MIKIFIKTQVLVLLFLSLGIFAQQNVSGLVTDTQGNPLPGVNVIIQGTSIGVSSDFDGNFQINAENGQILVFSFIGYNDQKLLLMEQFKM